MKILFIVPPHLSFSNFINPPEHGAQIYVKKDGHTYGNVITEPYLGCLSFFNLWIHGWLQYLK